MWAILIDEWGWEAIADDEWRGFTHQPRPAWPRSATGNEKRVPFQALPPARHFVGRVAEARQTIDHLRGENATPLALVGMGGVGKSSLAAQIAHDLRSDFADGVLWGSPAASHPTAILDSWAQAYGYDLARLSDAASKAAVVRDLLAGKRTLVVLDDVPSAESARLLLPGGVTCRVLITTRSREVAHALGADTLLLPSLRGKESLTLFTRTLNDERANADPAAARQICATLDHLPLAVEIAGQRLRTRPERTLAEFAHRLQGVQTVLSELRVSDRAVRASFETSWAALEPALQTTFARLAVFVARPFAADPVAGDLQ